MASRTPVLVARRRNEQQRRGEAFLKTLAEHTGLGNGKVRLVDPARSVELERRVYSFVREGIRSGGIERLCHLALSEAVSRCGSALQVLGEAEVDVLLCHSPDFIFRCRASVVAGALESLMLLDRDTVTVVSDDGTAGCALDAETEDAAKLFEVDLWGRLAPRR